VRHLGLFLYEYLGEEYPEVLGRVLRSPNDIDVFSVFKKFKAQDDGENIRLKHHQPLIFQSDIPSEFQIYIFGID